MKKQLVHSNSKTIFVEKYIQIRPHTWSIDAMKGFILIFDLIYKAIMLTISIFIITEDSPMFN